MKNIKCQYLNGKIRKILNNSCLNLYTKIGVSYFKHLISHLVTLAYSLDETLSLLNLLYLCDFHIKGKNPTTRNILFIVFTNLINIRSIVSVRHCARYWRYGGDHSNTVSRNCSLTSINLESVRT